MVGGKGRVSSWRQGSLGRGLGARWRTGAGMRCWRVGEGRSREPWAKGHGGMGQG